MKYDEYKKMKNFAVIIDQDKTNKTTEDNLETRINPKLSKTRQIKSILRKLDIDKDKYVTKTIAAAPYVLGATVNPVFFGMPGVSSSIAYKLAKGKVAKGIDASIYKMSGFDKFSKTYIFNVDPNRYYIIDYVDDLHISVYGNGSGYPSRYDAKRAFEDSNYMQRRQGVIRINKGSTLIENYPQKFRRIADD